MYNAFLCGFNSFLGKDGQCSIVQVNGCGCKTGHCAFLGPRENKTKKERSYELDFQFPYARGLRYFGCFQAQNSGDVWFLTSLGTKTYLVGFRK